jgi:hypothetical protein
VKACGSSRTGCGGHISRSSTFESVCPGYRGTQDTLRRLVKSVGRIYPQTFIDTCSKVGFGKLYTDPWYPLR